MKGVRCIALAALAAAIGVAQTPAFSGRWKLNPARSSWAGRQAPAAVTLEIEDRSPEFRYSGMVVNLHGDDRAFEFAGATDGKPYAAVRASGEGKVVLERVGPYAILANFKTNDGRIAESTRMTLSRDGRVMTYRTRVTGNGPTLQWTEVYERQ